MRMRSAIVLGAAAAALLLRPGLAPRAAAQERPAVLGRWDLVVHAAGGDYPGWLEVTQEGDKLAGRFQPRGGSVVPMKTVSFTDGKLVFTYGAGRNGNATRYEAELKDNHLVGKTAGPGGSEVTWEGKRAPALKRTGTPEWGKPIALFNGKDLTGWKPQYPNRPNGWEVQDGRLVNARPGNNLMTDQKFEDFKLHAEFNLPAGSNGGIYLRGRYEMQLEDSYGKEPESHQLGAIYGFLTPKVNAAKKAGEWQSCEITLVGRKVTIVLNDQPIIDAQEIPGSTGGALDSDEGAPGPILLQGDHGPLEFRNLVLTPAKRGGK